MKQKTYTKEELFKAIKTSTSIRQVLLTLGLKASGGSSYKNILDFIEKNHIDISHFTGQSWSKNKKLSQKVKTDDYLSNKKSITSHRLRVRLISEQKLLPKCSSCNLTEWLGNPMPLELDHIDGNHQNNELSNLRLLCPNCHAFTPTYKTKNWKK